MKIILIFFTAIILFSFPSYSQLPAYLPASGLMAWFPFTGNAVDSTGNGHDGSLFGPTMAKGRFGNANSAYSFNGISNYIFIPAGVFIKDRSVDITSSLTISAWVKSNNYTFSSQEQIYWRGDVTSAHDPHMLYFNGGEVRLRRDVDPGTTVNEVGYSLAGLDTNFHLFVGTYDSTTSYMCMYVDGILRTRSYLPGLQSYPTATMYNYIGAVDGGTWQFFYGIIDELAIWSRALTACEVAGLYYSIPNIIIGQPTNIAVAAGATANFSVNVATPSATYQWQANSGSGFNNLTNTAPYSGVYTPTLTISAVTASLSGNTYRCVVSSDSCLNRISDSASLTVSILGAPVYYLNQGLIFAINPNPNDGVFTVSSSSLQSKHLNVELKNVIGQIVHSEEVFLGNGQIDRQIALNNSISNGVYFLQISSEKVSEVFRIVLDR